jgi:glutathione synthase/RimK-type ligase-like ATP-grasp enzyme
VEALRSYGISVTAQPWDVPSHSNCPAIVRSAWNYHRKPAEFLSWINSHEAALWNHPATIRWNIDKFYLRDLLQQGRPIIPTVFLPRDGAADLVAILEMHNWPTAVVKPAISATAHRTWITTLVTAASQQRDLDALLSEHGVLIQKFMSEIQTTGELSLVFFNGAFSHSMQKNAAAGDFRALRREPRISLPALTESSVGQCS